MRVAADWRLGTIPCRGTGNFSLCHHVQNKIIVYLASYPVVTGAFLRDNVSRLSLPSNADNVNNELYISVIYFTSAVSSLDCVAPDATSVNSVVFPKATI
jgi:hypothetical protein